MEKAAAVQTVLRLASCNMHLKGISLWEGLEIHTNSQCTWFIVAAEGIASEIEPREAAKSL